ncbi:sensor histidine kinase [Duganella sp. FT92W]|uniref:Sensor histidine kinase n=1 Tax=Pseudoduganella rivuli TaxID=2666085 RepID=A0A7X2IPQ8_9BURK|nr:histidine kinase [Pseudoduganella rivuli]MRV73902.1 sensor histidine kinase [Pseudoduganella rivuli]
MLSPIGNRRGAALYLLAWLLLGVAIGGATAAAFDTPWFNAMLFAVPATMLYGVGAGFSAYYLCRAYPLSERSLAGVVTALGASAVVSALLWSALLGGWNALCGWLEVAWAGIPYTPPLKAVIFGLGVLLYGLLAAVNYLATESERASNAQQRELQSRLAAREAELRMLRTQIDPHFLFNSLNSISALTSQNPKGAREMTLQLAGFFRLSLGVAERTAIPLSQEMQLVRHFLAVEKVRFGDRLQLEEAIHADAESCLVPPMIIQPLVENAVKHGIAGLPDGGKIRVAARRAGSQLQVVVDNAMDDDEAPSSGGKGNGIGLANVRQRLAGCYGTEAAVHWGARDGVFVVEMTLPARTAEAGSEYSKE